MTIYDILQLAENVGCPLIAEGEHIRVMNISNLPASLGKEIRAYKQEILEVLRMDEKAKAAGLVIGLPGELYTLSLGKQRALYVEQINSQWVAWRETYQTGREPAISSKTIVKAATLDYALEQVARYLEYLSKFRRK